jgi:hypothetical protein
MKTSTRSCPLLSVAGCRLAATQPAPNASPDVAADPAPECGVEGCCDTAYADAVVDGFFLPARSAQDGDGAEMYVASCGLAVGVGINVGGSS